MSNALTNAPDRDGPTPPNLTQFPPGNAPLTRLVRKLSSERGTPFHALPRGGRSGGKVTAYTCDPAVLAEARQRLEARANDNFASETGITMSPELPAPAPNCTTVDQLIQCIKDDHPEPTLVAALTDAMMEQDGINLPDATRRVNQILKPLHIAWTIGTNPAKYPNPEDCHLSSHDRAMISSRAAQYRDRIREYVGRHGCRSIPVVIKGGNAAPKFDDQPYAWEYHPTEEIFVGAAWLAWYFVGPDEWVMRYYERATITPTATHAGGH